LKKKEVLEEEEALEEEIKMDYKPVPEVKQQLLVQQEHSRQSKLC
jgi:hypothetical protein